MKWNNKLKASCHAKQIYQSNCLSLHKMVERIVSSQCCTAVQEKSLSYSGKISYATANSIGNMKNFNSQSKHRNRNKVLFTRSSKNTEDCTD